jgi:hypothetical protein
MADINDQKYLIPCPNRIVIDAAIRDATQMLARAKQRLQAGPPTIPEDTRLWTPLHQAYVDIFKVRPGVQSMAQIQNIKDNFGYLAQAATRITPLCVSDAHPFISTTQGKMGHEAFSEVGNDSSPTIYFGSPFFRCTRRQQAKTVVHELAHGRLGVGHTGGEFLSFSDDACETTPLRTFDEAISNAYAYDRFAECASSSR